MYRQTDPPARLTVWGLWSYKEREKRFRKEMESLRAQGVIPHFALEVGTIFREVFIV